MLEPQAAPSVAEEEEEINAQLQLLASEVEADEARDLAQQIRELEAAVRLKESLLGLDQGYEDDAARSESAMACGLAVDAVESVDHLSDWTDDCGLAVDAADSVGHLEDLAETMPIHSQLHFDNDAAVIEIDDDEDMEGGSEIPFPNEASLEESSGLDSGGGDDQAGWLGSTGEHLVDTTPVEAIVVEDDDPVDNDSSGVGGMEEVEEVEVEMEEQWQPEVNGRNGYVFVCSTGTQQKFQALGLLCSPESDLPQMKDCIANGTRLFLHNSDNLRLIGTFTAVSEPALDLVPGTFGKYFKAQVRVLPVEPFAEAQLGRRISPGPRTAEEVTELVKLMEPYVSYGNTINLKRAWSGAAVNGSRKSKWDYKGALGKIKLKEPCVAHSARYVDKATARAGVLRPIAKIGKFQARATRSQLNGKGYDESAFATSDQAKLPHRIEIPKLPKACGSSSKLPKACGLPKPAQKIEIPKIAKPIGETHGKDEPARAYNLQQVVVNFANVGATFACVVLRRDKQRGDRLFDWEGVRRCIRCLSTEQSLQVVGVVFENFSGPDNGKPVAKGIPDDIRNMCHSVQETPRLCGQKHKSADDEVTIKCAYRRNCRFLDNDNYRDWKCGMRDDTCRKWLESCQDLLQMRYFFDSELGSFDVLDGNIPAR